MKIHLSLSVFDVVLWDESGPLGTGPLSIPPERKSAPML